MILEPIILQFSIIGTENTYVPTIWKRTNHLKASSICSVGPILIKSSLLVFFRYCLPSMGMITYSETLKSLLLDCLLNSYFQTNSLQVVSYYWSCLCAKCKNHPSAFGAVGMPRQFHTEKYKQMLIIWTLKTMAKKQNRKKLVKNNLSKLYLIHNVALCVT